ncbi:unnamed protein product [marine sediment metagenome]|uniref:Uncharacterized protein n=1 Tax=marine sediment metagenome TaxID=412755 RepID=X1B7U1_9ZZZZ
MGLEDILADLIQSAVLDTSSGIPGLFTLAAIISRLEFGLYEGKGKGGALTPAQVRAAKSWLRDNCEKKVIKGKVYYKPRW